MALLRTSDRLLQVSPSITPQFCQTGQRALPVVKFSTAWCYRAQQPTSVEALLEAVFNFGRIPAPVRTAGISSWRTVIRTSARRSPRQSADLYPDSSTK